MRRKNLLTISAVLLTAASCTLFAPASGTLSDTELSTIQSRIMTTFEILNGAYLPADRALTPFMSSGNAAQARATVPTWGTTSYDLPDDVGASLTGSQANYPEPGQNSSWTVTKTTVSNVYEVIVTTTFPETTDPRNSQVESYYILDQAGIGTWTNADPICEPDGTPNAAYRKSPSTLVFDDDSVQTETIVDVDARFKAFDIEGSLDYPSAFRPEAGDATAAWSSVVVYTRSIADSPSFSFWNGNRLASIVGVRYYTEHLIDSDTKLVGTTIVFEKAVTVLNSESGDFLDPDSSLYLPTLAATPDQGYLALSVVRQQIIYDYDAATGRPDYMNASRDTRTRTRVVNIDSQRDDYVDIINGEAAEITEAYDTLWIPTGSDAAIVNLETAPTVETKTSNLAVSTDDSVPVEIVTDTPIGDAGTLYAAINGAAIESIVSSDIVGDILDTNGSRLVATYNGKQGTLIDTTEYAFNDKGTVQAWVYVKKTTNTPGIVHAGIASDFSDEIWTLQFLGSDNTPVFALSAQGPAYTYDLVTSSQKLNLGTWYYLVATWDRAANRMKIYVNGVEKGSKGFNNIKATSTFASGSPVVIGSQFYDGTKTLSGYYGFNGKINGVIIDHRVWSADEISIFYENNKAKTSTW